MNVDLSSLKEKVDQYHQVLKNTETFRDQWKNETKNIVKKSLEQFVSSTGMKANILEKNAIENLESLVFDLGRSKSGLAENIEDSDIKRVMIKSNGSLVYQQLFNGKIMVMINNPFIEGYGEPKPPIPIEIARPEELSEQQIHRHIELLLKNITTWEDYDDNEPQKTKIGFQPLGIIEEQPEHGANGNEEIQSQ